MKKKRALPVKGLKYFFLIFTLCSFCILNFSCGLDVYYYLTEPACYDVKQYTNTDPLEDCFLFKTAESSNYDSSSSSAFKFSGTQIYYKIYNSYSTMVSRENTISSLLTSTTASATAAKDQLDSWGYKTLKFSNKVNTPDPIVKSSGSGTDQWVYLRLVNSADSDDYQACLCVSSSTMEKCESDKAQKDAAGNVLPPLRNIMDSSNTEYLSFNFGGEGDYDATPSSSDADVYYSTTSQANTWYLDLYAVSTGWDTATYDDYYSKPVFLGSMTIEEGVYSSK